MIVREALIPLTGKNSRSKTSTNRFGWASTYTATTGGMKKEYQKVEDKLRSASIIKEDEEIVREERFREMLEQHGIEFAFT